MRNIIAATIVAFAALSGHSAMAADKNPFEIPKDKYHRGLVVIAIDRPGFELAIEHFDPVKRKPYVKLKWFGNPDWPILKSFTNKQGHQFLVGSISEGEAVIVSYYFSLFGNCFDAETYHFHVKPGSYNFIGHFDDGPSQRFIVEALESGRIGKDTTENFSQDYPIIGRKLEGFTPGDSLPETRAEVEQMVAQELGRPVEVLTPALGKTNFYVSTNPLGRSICNPMVISDPRPDPSKPAVIDYTPDPTK